MTKVTLTVAELRERTRSLFDTHYSLTRYNQDEKIRNSIRMCEQDAYFRDFINRASAEVYLFLVECSDSLCVVRIIEYDGDEDNVNCESLVTVLSELEFNLFQEVISHNNNRYIESHVFLK